MFLVVQKEIIPTQRGLSVRIKRRTVLGFRLLRSFFTLSLVFQLFRTRFCSLTLKFLHLEKDTKLCCSSSFNYIEVLVLKMEEHENGANAGEEEPMIGPGPAPRARPKRPLQFEQAYLNALPSANMSVSAPIS